MGREKYSLYRVCVIRTCSTSRGVVVYDVMCVVCCFFERRTAVIMFWRAGSGKVVPASRELLFQSPSKSRNGGARDQVRPEGSREYEVPIRPTRKHVERTQGPPKNNNTFICDCHPFCPFVYLNLLFHCSYDKEERTRDSMILELWGEIEQRQKTRQ